MPDDSAALPAPGWYPHPAHLGTELYWDGAAWTDRSRPAAAPVPVYGTPSATAPTNRGASAAYGSGGEGNPSASPARSSAGRNPMAVASLVLGILSIVANILLVPSILAIVFGVRGRAAAPSAGGGGLATGGLVTGIIGMAFSGISFLARLGEFAGLAG